MLPIFQFLFRTENTSVSQLNFVLYVQEKKEDEEDQKEKSETRRDKV